MALLSGWALVVCREQSRTTLHESRTSWLQSREHRLLAKPDAKSFIWLYYPKHRKLLSSEHQLLAKRDEKNSSGAPWVRKRCMNKTCGCIRQITCESSSRFSMIALISTILPDLDVRYWLLWILCDFRYFQKKMVFDFHRHPLMFIDL